MKKYLFVLLGLLVFAGCSDNNANDSVDVDVDNTPEVEVEDPVVDLETEEDTTEADDETTDGTGDDLTMLEEYAIIDDNIELSALSAKVEEDNPGTRVILFEDESGKQVYKSVFVKNDQHLKIIKMDDEGLLYNDFIK